MNHGRIGLVGVVLVSAQAPALAQFVEPDATAAYQLQYGGGFGWAVSELRDIDGDGVMEGIGSSPRFRSNTGKVVVFSGATGAVLIEVDGPSTGTSLGWSIADGGDVDNDGFVDVIMGSPSWNGTGGVIVFSGNPATPGAVVWQVFGAASGGFGYAVSTLDDTNGDGHADFVVGSPGFDGVNADEGRVFVYDGASGAVLHELVGSGAANAALGQGVAGVGDLDGDGVSDVAASEVGTRTLWVWSGATGQRIHGPLAADPGTSGAFGQFFVGRCGDVSGDGVPDIYAGDYADSKGYVYSGADGSRWLTIEAPPADGLGPGRGLMADINQDGHDDLILGHYTNSDGASGAGKMVIYSGKDGTPLRTVTGNIGGVQLGFDCVGVGDVTGDGWPDVIASGSARNRVYMVPGVNPCPADLTADATLDQDDIDLFVAAFLAGEPAADLDFSGALNLDDVGAFAGSFIAGCP
ncbi:MAG: FG-GAP-like repeat-containing protein [Phycisphaerales bacterium]